jgi:AmmeMemoRadiSam system protein B
VAEPLEVPRLRPVETFPAEVRGEQVLCLRDPEGVTDAVLSVHRSLLPILALLDGTRSLVEVQAEIMRQHGELVLRSQLEAMVEVLDQHFFLEGARLDLERARQRQAFRDGASRPAMHAGRAYPGEPEQLAASLAAHLEGPEGPGAIGPRHGGVLRGLIAPHIDFTRGGPAYAWGYRALAEAAAADCFVVLGTAHGGLDGHRFAVTTKPYETPFGALEVDREVLEAFAARAPGDLHAAEWAHRSEHSIEFQAVWLRYLHRERRHGPTMVPVLASFVHEYLAQGRDPREAPEVTGVLDALRDAMAAVPRRYCVIAGADLAHVGPRFGDRWAAGPEERARVAADDRALLDALTGGDAGTFFAEARRQRDRNRVCGLSPIYALRWLVPDDAGRLLRYGQWPDPEGTVTFASVAFGAEATPP